MADRSLLLGQQESEADDDEYVDVFTSDLSVLQKLRLLWDEFVVRRQRQRHVFGVLFATVVVLGAWRLLLLGAVDSEGGVFDDGARDAPADWAAPRLPPHVAPLGYALRVAVSPSDFDSGFDSDADFNSNSNLSSNLSFNGSVDIALALALPTRVVVVHAAAGLAVAADSAAISTLVASTRGNGEVAWSTVTVPVSAIRVDAANEYLVLKFDRPLRAGLWSLHLSFTGNLSTSLPAGFYRSSYKTATNETRFLANTHFFPTDARRAFPCLDEPSMKATFQLNLTVPRGLNAFTNTPPVSELTLENEDLKTYVFNATPRMSTYLVSFLVSDFERLSGTTHRNISISVLAAPDRIDRAHTALHYAVKMMEYYESAYKIDYPMEKMDLAAVPTLSVGAMENFGLVIYKEETLLEDKQVSKEQSEQGIASIVAHELAHQWFGNLVTMKWWNDVYLNEGFATFMTAKAVHAVEPTWRHQDTFFFGEAANALFLDASEFTHAIAANVDHASQINEVFDAIAYDKGSSLLRMLEQWLEDVAGRNYFMTKIGEYLQTYAYSNAETADLWRALDKPGLNVASVMNDWTRQPGYPLLNVSGDPLSAGFEIQQSRYFSNGRRSTSTDQSWSIPLRVYTYTRSGVRIGGIWTQMMTGNQTITISEEDHVFLLNPGRKGFFRVQYPDWVWALFSEWALSHSLAPVDVAGLMSDSFALSFSGHLEDASIPVVVFNSLFDETDRVIWKTAVLDPIVTNLGWTETTTDKTTHHTRALLRAEVLDQAVAVNHAETVSRALAYFQQLKNSSNSNSNNEPSSFPIHLTGLIWNTGVMYGTDQDFEFVLTAFFRLIATSSPSAHTHVWMFVKERWSDIISRWSDSNSNNNSGTTWTKVNQFLEQLVAMFVEQSAILEAEQLFLVGGGGWFVPPLADVAIKKGLEIAKRRAEWVKLNRRTVRDWLKAQSL
ncbi:peptidase family M1-domain-containing protein [Obelidium mucronatum]|nr:peptidase family M1-domain-containing protein [Obelidium mucronatum]